MIGGHGYADGRPTAAECPFASAIDPTDTSTYFYDSFQTARECHKTPTGVMSPVNPPSVPNHDTVVVCVTSHHGLAGGCAAKFENPRWHGVPGVLPYFKDRGLDFITVTAAPGQNA
eukprot:8257838-Pyramimonas_sp.AAC.1